MTPEVEIWTDGSCDNKEGTGGWGAVIVIDGIIIERFGSAVNTTSNRMEITAVLGGLSAIKTPVNVNVYTDSQYVRNGMVKGGWLDRGSSIKNHDLWVKMMKLINRHILVKPIWVRGHSDIELNERADTLAGEARLKRLRK